MKPAASSLVATRSLRRPVGAFTLIEIMIVVSIAAILLATALPAFVRAMQKEDLRKAVSDIVEGCSHARAQAILKGVPMEMVIKAEDGSISVQPAQVRADSVSFDGTTGVPAAADSSGGSNGFSGQIPENVAVKLLYVNFKDQMEQAESRVRFFPNGTSDEFTIIIFSDKGERKISLDIITALADVENIR
jgi:prepilin-type N-terminal cleavage/methylation domain-containing protein